MVNTLYISEFCRGGVGGSSTIAAQPSNAEQAIAFTTHTESSALKNNTQLVRLQNDSGSPCSIAFGAAPVATTSMCRMAANQTEYFTVPINSGYKVSVVSNT